MGVGFSEERAGLERRRDLQGPHGVSDEVMPEPQCSDPCFFSPESYVLSGLWLQLKGLEHIQGNKALCAHDTELSRATIGTHWFINHIHPYLSTSALNSTREFQNK